MQEPNRHLDFFIDPSFQGVNKLFVFSFENKDDRRVSIKYYFPKVERKDYNFMINGKNFFNQPVKKKLKTYDNTRKFATGEANGYTTSYLVD